MSIQVITGLPGSGKTAKLSQTTESILSRNFKHFQKTGFRRFVYLNFRLSDTISDEYRSFIIYWKDIDELLKITEGDIFIDELSIYFDSQEWATISRDIKFFLRQHRKLGIDIYATAQDFNTVDIAFRRLTDSLLYAVKIMGTPPPRATKKKTNKPWGVFAYRNVKPSSYKEEKEKYEYTFLPTFSLFLSEDFSIYDTRELIETPSTIVYVKHIVQRCKSCGYEKVIHK